MVLRHKQNILLAKLDPRVVIVDPSLVRPSDWDLKAIPEDLEAYVQRSRLIKATPAVRLIGGEFKLISGAPFIRAAQRVSPPLEVVVCLIEIAKESLEQLQVELTTATALLDEHPPSQTYQAIEMLNFAHRLTAAEQRLIEQRILAFFEVMSTHPQLYGGQYLSLDPFDWNTLATTLTWSWKRNDQEGRHLAAFLDLLSDLDREIAALKSWNGMSYSAMQQ